MIARKGLLAFTSLTVALTLLAGSAVAFGYAWQGSAGDRIQQKDRLKDGSCVAADQLRTRDRLKDGSCVAATRLWTRERLRDASGDRTGTADRLRTRSRLRDGSCTA